MYVESARFIETKGERTSDDNGAGEEKRYKWDVVWVNVVLLFFLHVGAVYGCYLRLEAKFSTQIFYKTVLLMTSLGVTVGAHRLWCHRTFNANKVYQIFWMCILSMSYQNSIFVWVRDHRLHHKYSETDADPHNANRGFFFSHVGWLMLRKHEDVKGKGKTIDMSDLEANPVVMFQHRHYYVLVLLLGIGASTFVPWYFWGESLKVAFFTATIYRYIVAVHHSWLINSLAHVYGTRPYDRTIGPAENTVLKFIVAGEGFHNYHHTFPWDYKTSEIGSDGRNVSTQVIDFFAWIGWVTNRKSVPKSIVEMKITRTGDGTHEKPAENTRKILGLVELETLTMIRNHLLFFFHIYVIL